MYNFDNLDPSDFEKLIRDILREIYGGVQIERFARGRDGGIDLRFCHQDRTHLVQCKNYARSDFSALKSTLKREEAARIRRLNFDSYLLVTSVSLTPERKRKLAAALDHQIEAENIWGLEEINDYLSEYPQVEKRAAYRRYPVSEDSALQTLKVMTGMYIDSENGDRLRFINPGLEDFLNRKMNDSFEEEDYRILLEAVPTAETVQNILARTDANRKLGRWETLGERMGAVMTGYFFSLHHKAQKLGRLRRFGKLLASGVGEPFFAEPGGPAVPYPAGLKRMAEQTTLDILTGAGGDPEAEKLLLNLIDFAGEGSAAGLLTEEFTRKALPLLHSEIMRCLEQRDEYNNDEIIYLYCLFGETYPQHHTPETDESVRMLVEAKREGELYRLFSVYTYNPFEKIDLIGRFFGLDMGLTLEEFKWALEDYHSVLEECRDEEELYSDRCFAEESRLRELFWSVYKEAAPVDAKKAVGISDTEFCQRPAVRI